MIEKQQRGARRNHDNNLRIGNSHKARFLNQENIQNHVQQAEYNDIDHVDFGMAGGDDKGIPDEIGYILEEKKQKKGIGDQQHGRGKVFREKALENIGGGQIGCQDGQSGKKGDPLDILLHFSRNQRSVLSTVKRHNIRGLNLGGHEKRHEHQHQELVDNFIIVDLGDKSEVSQNQRIDPGVKERTDMNRADDESIRANGFENGPVQNAAISPMEQTQTQQQQTIKKILGNQCSPQAVRFDEPINEGQRDDACRHGDERELFELPQAPVYAVI